MTHAFFKGLLFLAAGSVIHGVGGEQDMRKMGGLRQYMPWTFWTMTVATLCHRRPPAVCRLLLEGRDPVESLFEQRNWVYWLIGVITAFITSFYMFRLWFLTFFGEYRGPNPETRGCHGHDADHATC
jgi:NADH-quinone oxidoreductase subunit L